MVITRIKMMYTHLSEDTIEILMDVYYFQIFVMPLHHKIHTIPIQWQRDKLSIYIEISPGNISLLLRLVINFLNVLE